MDSALNEQLFNILNSQISQFVTPTTLLNGIQALL